MATERKSEYLVQENGNELKQKLISKGQNEAVNSDKMSTEEGGDFNKMNCEVQAEGVDKDLHRNEHTARLMLYFHKLNIQTTTKPYTKKGNPYTLNQEEKSITHFIDNEDNSDPNVVYCKNLFLKDRKGQYYLVIVEEGKIIDLKKLKLELSAHRNLSFADEESMARLLQVSPGNISPFSVIFESAKDVQFAIDPNLSKCPHKMAFHPFDENLQVEIVFDELEKFVKNFNCKLQILGEVNTKTESSDGKKKKADLEKNHKKSKIVSKVKDSSPEVKEYDINGDKQPIRPKTLKLLEKTDSNSRPSFDNQSQQIDHYKSFTSKSDRKVNKELLQDAADSNERQDKSKSCSLVKTYDRKGKLRSFLKKQNIANEDAESDDKTSQTYKSKISSLSHIQPLDTPSSTRLPEVNKFYRQLDSLNISYKEFDLTKTDSREIGPSLGCRTILLKDRRQNYFVIITHEFYCLDYGRLKKTLKPKKKLEPADDVDIMTVLGVDSQRLTPFILKEYNKDINVRLFFTQKIWPDPIKLNILHPFASRHRLVMTSSELRRFLSESGGPIGMIEEKAWHPRYSTIFTQFERKENKNISIKSLISSSPVLNNKIDDNALDTTFSYLLWKRCSDILLSAIYFFWPNFSHQFQGHLVNRGSPVDPAKFSHTETKIKSGSQENQVSTKFVTTQAELKSNKEKIFKFGKLTNDVGQAKNLDFLRKNIPPDSRNNHDCLAKTDIYLDEIVSHLSKLGVKFTFKKKSHNPSDSDETKERDIKNEGKYQSTDLDYDDGTDIKLVDNDTENLTLFENQDLFTMKTEIKPFDVLNNCNNNDICDNQTMGSYLDDDQIIDSYLDEEADIERSYLGKDIERVDQDDDESDEDDHYQIRIRNVESSEESEVEDNDDNMFEITENCHTVHFHDKSGNIYFVVCGEGDVISKPRFRRRFQIENFLYYCDKMRAASRGEVLLTPFSISMADFSQGSGLCYVALTTTVYMDNNTRLKFKVDDSGSCVWMSVEEFEKYLKMVGTNVWYMS